MFKLFTISFFIFCLFGISAAQIEIDGDMLDWAGIEPLTQGEVAEVVGDVPVATYADFDLANMYITHDTSNVYVRIDLADAASFANFYNFTNPPVFEFYMDTEIGDTTGFDWGWWNLAMNYYVSFNLHPDSVTKSAELWHYYGGRTPNGEFEFVTSISVAVNDDQNAIEFAIPRDMVNFGTTFRPWMYSVGDFQWTDGADQMPEVGGSSYMIKYDFWEGGSVYMHRGPQINSDIQIDGDMLDWAAIPVADVDEIAEELGDMPTGPEFDVMNVSVTSDSTYLYMKIDIDPSGTFAGIYSYENWSAFQIFFDVNMGDTTGLGYGGFWRYPVDYMVDLSDALHPDSTGNETAVYQYIADWAGAFEDFAELEGVTAMFAKNEDDNSLEIAIPRSALNVDTDVRPWLYVVGNEDWDNEEYFPNSVAEVVDPPYYGLNYNFITGASIVNPSDNSIVSIIERKKQQVARGFGIVENYPNPFNPSTTIHFSLAEKAPITVEVYNVLGRKISTLVNNQVLTAGEKYIGWNGRNDGGTAVASGIYLYKIVSGNSSVVKKMVLVK